MKLISLIIVLSISSFIFVFIWEKLNIKKKFSKYTDDLKKVISSLNNLETKDLDVLSISGIQLILSFSLSLFPSFLAYFLIYKIIASQILSLLLTTLIFSPLLIKKK
tara:strand:- start:254 stop:574 length:321 start_codon:yes stop_codon:yes gene_type:complete